MTRATDPDQLVIEKAGPDDAEDLRRIQTQTWYDTYPNRQRGITRAGLVTRQEGINGERNADRIAFWRNQISTAGKDHAVYMARLDGQTIGYVSCHMQSGQWRISALYVLPQSQSAGVGAKLLQVALDWFKPGQDVYIHVAEYNDRAIKFYERYGFVLTGKRFEDDGPRESNIPELEMLRKAS